CTNVARALTECQSSAGTPGPPGVAPDDVVVLFGAYEGDAVSTATLVGQDDGTQTARVVIEPGTASLSVLLTSYEPVIWRFEGAVDRVSQVLLLGRAGGVTGVAAGRVIDHPWGPATDSYFY